MLVSPCLLQVSQLALRQALAHKQYGKALKVLHKQLEDKNSKELEKKCIEVRAISESATFKSWIGTRE